MTWVEDVEVVLGEHMYADKINAGLAQGLSFQDTFGEEADGDLEEVRRTFLVKAFQRRQAALLSHLLAAGHSSETLIAMTMAELETAAARRGGREIGAALSRTAWRRRSAADPTRGPSSTAEGAKLNGETLRAISLRIRRVGVNAEFNGALCRGLLAARFDLDTPLKTRSRTCRRTGVALRLSVRSTVIPSNRARVLHGEDDAARSGGPRGARAAASPNSPRRCAARSGPKGMNAIIDRPIGTPIVSRDGVSIASEIELEDPFENMGAQVLREVSKQTNEVAGDGTTTATVLADVLVQDGLRAARRWRQSGRTGGGSGDRRSPRPSRR